MLASQLETLIDEQALQSQDPEDRYLTTGVSWQQYEALLVQLGDRPGFRVSYLDGVLEIVSPSLRHEDTKSRIGDLLLIYFLETDTEYYPKGSTTFWQQERRGGTEADESYCIGTDKALPDLAIEVIVTSGGLNRLEVYSRLQVPEVWFWHHDGFSLYHLREETSSTFIQTYGFTCYSQLSQITTSDFAGGRRGQLLDKLDVARVLVRQQARAYVLGQFTRQRWRGPHTLTELYEYGSADFHVCHPGKTWTDSDCPSSGSRRTRSGQRRLVPPSHGTSIAPSSHNT